MEEVKEEKKNYWMKFVTIGLILFIVWAIYFAQTASALSVTVTSPNGGETWYQNTTQQVSYTIGNCGVQTDFNSTCNATGYWSKVSGARQNSIFNKTPLFTTINPDANSQGWIGGAIPQAQILYDTNSENIKDGQGSVQIDRHTGNLYYPSITKWIPDLNLSDMNKNGGHLSFWVKSSVKYDVAQSVYLVNAADEAIAWWGAAYCTAYAYSDTNYVWKQIILDLNQGTNFVCSNTDPITSFDKNIIKGIKISANVPSNNSPDNNVWIDGIRIYDNHNCVSFDGNQEKNTNCSTPWLLPVDANLTDIYIDVNISNGTDTNQDSSDTSFNNIWDANTTAIQARVIQQTITGYTAISDATITLQRIIVGSWTQTEQTTTDQGGKATVHTNIGTTYRVYVSKDGSFLSFGDLNYGEYNITPSMTELLIIIPSTTGGGYDFNKTIISDVNFMVGNTIKKTGSLIHFDQNFSGENINSVNITIMQGTNELFNNDYSGSDTNFLSKHFEQNITETGVDENKSITVIVTLTKSSGQDLLFYKTYGVLGVSQNDLQNDLTNFQYVIGQTATLLLVLFFGILATGLVSMASDNQDKNNSTFFGMIVFGFFTAIAWLPIELFVLLCMAAFVGYSMNRQETR